MSRQEDGGGVEDGVDERKNGWGCGCEEECMGHQINT